MSRHATVLPIRISAQVLWVFFSLPCVHHEDSASRIVQKSLELLQKLVP